MVGDHAVALQPLQPLDPAHLHVHLQMGQQPL